MSHDLRAGEPAYGIEIPCARIVELVTEYLEGAVSPARRRLIGEHLADCPPCSTYFEQIRTTIELVGSVEESDLSPEAWTRLRATFGQIL